MIDSGGGQGVTRRNVLAAAGVSAVPVLAGCLGGGSGGEATADGEDSIRNHPGAAGLQDQPTKGPNPFEVGTAIVAFEDPSCTRCRAFEQNTVPKIESELVDPGKAALVFRGYPVVYPWGKPATQALEATYARDPDAFWALKDHYYAEQPTFDSDNVLRRTGEFLSAETGVDAEAVVTDAREKAYDAAVQADLDAGEKADVGRVTPTVLLFKDGTYRTRASGSVSFSVVKNALGL